MVHKLFLAIVLCMSMVPSGNLGSTQEPHAEGAVAEAHTEEHTESPWSVVFRWTNFLILFGGLGYLLRKPAREFFDSRRQEISSGLERAQRAQLDAQARMSEIEEKLGRLSIDVAALRDEAERESGQDRERIFAETKREVERVMEQSKQEIERAGRSVEKEIREHIADLVVDRAGKTLRTEMTQDDQRRVIVRFINDLQE